MNAWYLFLLITAGTTTSVNGPLSTKADCEYMLHQVEKELRPFRAGCIEVPAPRPKQ